MSHKKFDIEKLNIFEVFRSYRNVSFSIGVWNDITNDLCQALEPLHRKSEGVNITGEKGNTNTVEAHNYINDDYRFVQFEDTVYGLEFENFYPQITRGVIDGLEFSPVNYGEAWKEVYDAYTDPRAESFQSSLYNIMKKWLNWSFGAVNNRNTEVKADISYQNLIKKRANHIIEEIRTTFNSRVVMTDTDKMYIIGWPDRFDLKKFVDQYEYEYNVIQLEKFIPISEKRYIGVRDGEFLACGVKNLSESKIETLI